jgi:hypothetical protein
MECFEGITFDPLSLAVLQQSSPCENDVRDLRRETVRAPVTDEDRPLRHGEGHLDRLSFADATLATGRVPVGVLHFQLAVGSAAGSIGEKRILKPFPVEDGSNVEVQTPGKDYHGYGMGPQEIDEFPRAQSKGDIPHDELLHCRHTVPREQSRLALPSLTERNLPSVKLFVHLVCYSNAVVGKALHEIDRYV